MAVCVVSRHVVKCVDSCGQKSVSVIGRNYLVILGIADIADIVDIKNLVLKTLRKILLRTLRTLRTNALPILADIADIHIGMSAMQDGVADDFLEWSKSPNSRVVECRVAVRAA